MECQVLLRLRLLALLIVRLDFLDLLGCLERHIVWIEHACIFPKHSELLDGVLLLSPGFSVLKILNDNIGEDLGDQLVEGHEMLDNLVNVSFLVDDGPQVLYDLLAMVVASHFPIDLLVVAELQEVQELCLEQTWLVKELLLCIFTSHSVGVSRLHGNQSLNVYDGAAANLLMLLLRLFDIEQ